MWFNDLRQWLGGLKYRAVLSRSADRVVPLLNRRFHPRLEPLEELCLPSTLTVMNLSDHDPGSLRDAITQAAAGDTIDFADGLQGTIILTTGELAIRQDVDIEGPGAAQIAVSGNHASRVFDISSGANVTLAGLTIANGQTKIVATNTNAFAFAGGIYNAGTLILTDCIVSGSLADAEINNGSGHVLVAYSYGGGLFNSGTASLSDCAFISNTVEAQFSASGGNSVSLLNAHGGGIANVGLLMAANCRLDSNVLTAGGEGGALYNSGQAVITGSTFSRSIIGAGSHGNILQDPNAYGGGIANDQGILALINCTVANNQVMNDLSGPGQATSLGGGIYSLGELSTINCTIAGNMLSATGQGGASALAQGGGVFVDPYSPHGAQLVNTVVASNISTMQGPDVFGPFVSLGSNLIGKTDGSNGWIASDLTGTVANPLNAMLGMLGNNGGPTQTIPPLKLSPALDAGDPNYAPPTDQRGVSRGAIPNIGAYEATVSQLMVAGPVNVTAGQPFNVAVAALDPYNQPAYGYTGTVDLYSTDDEAPFLGEYTFTLADGGQYIFTGVVLYTSGLQTISAYDDGGLTGSYDLLVLSGDQPVGAGGHAAVTQEAASDAGLASAFLGGTSSDVAPLSLATTPVRDVQPLAIAQDATCAPAVIPHSMDAYFLVLEGMVSDSLMRDAPLLLI